MREANVSLLSTDNEMRCIKISVIHLEKGVRLTDHILHSLQRYSSKPHIAISVKSFNGSFGAYEIHYPISWGHPCNAMIVWQKKRNEYILLILSVLITTLQKQASVNHDFINRIKQNTFGFNYSKWSVFGGVCLLKSTGFFQSKKATDQPNRLQVDGAQMKVQKEMAFCNPFIRIRQSSADKIWSLNISELVCIDSSDITWKKQCSWF